MERPILRCQNSKIWIPNQYLTEVVGSCDRGQFKLIRRVECDCTLDPHGRLFVQYPETEPLAPGSYRLDEVRCGNCGGPVEQVSVDDAQILSRIRDREVDMKEQSANRMTPPPQPRPKQD